jgi:hypothetical protein
MHLATYTQFHRFSFGKTAVPSLIRPQCNLTHLSRVHELRGVNVEEVLCVLQPHVGGLHQLRVGARQGNALNAAIARPEEEEEEETNNIKHIIKLRFDHHIFAASLLTNSLTKLPQ